MCIPFLIYHSEARKDMRETNIAVVRSFFYDVINKGDLPALEKIFSEDFTDHYASPDIPKGIGGFKQFLTTVATAYPDIQAKIEDIIAEDDKVVVRLSFNGTQTGTLMGNIPPSGKHVDWTGIDIFRLRDGKITDRWSQRDLLKMLIQLGAYPK